MSLKRNTTTEHSPNEMREYLMAELKAMLGTMDEKCRCNRDECNRSALVWIENNAAAFREQWNREKCHHISSVCSEGIES
jgi:hypothetical protein